MKTIFKHLKNKEFSLAIDLIDPNISHQLVVPNYIKNQKKIDEWINTRQLIKSLWPQLNVSHNKYGAPQVEKRAISISHTNKYVGVILSQKKAAIDIEQIRPKALKLSSKFMSNQETLKFKDQESASICWSAKECMFKIHQVGNVDFIKDLRVEAIEKDFVICYMFDQCIKLNFEKFDDHVLVYYYE